MKFDILREDLQGIKKSINYTEETCQEAIKKADAATLKTKLLEERIQLLEMILTGKDKNKHNYIISSKENI